MGNFAPSLALYTSLSINLLRPKSATFTWECSPTKQFRAARSLLGVEIGECVGEDVSVGMGGGECVSRKVGRGSTYQWEGRGGGGGVAFITCSTNTEEGPVKTHQVQ